MTSSFIIESTKAILPLLGEQTLKFASDHGAASQMTILLGRNGSGKSTLLRELTQTFRHIGRGTRSVSQYFRQAMEVTWLADGNRTLVMPPTLNKSSVDEKTTAGLFDHFAPRRIIAVSFTPFDKFPAGDDITREYRARTTIDPYYVYLGFRSETVGGSPRTRLLNSVDQLAFRHSTPQANIRAAVTLRSIGYEPRISIGFKRTPGHTSRSELPGGIEDLFKSAGHELSYTLDFDNGDHNSDLPISYDHLAELTRGRVLRVSSVKLFPIDREQVVEMLQLSSGELNILSGFLGLAAYLEDGCLVLIDEPENSLHPEWQVRYVSMLNEVVKTNRGSHYIIATHSPLIVSGSAGNGAKVLRLDQEPIELERAMVEASPDATLVNAFDVITPGNTYIQKLVLEMMNLIERGQHNSPRAVRISDFLASMFESFQDDDPIKNLVRDIIVSRQNA